MSKDIGDLSEEEIGHLFPIDVVPYNPEWETIFEKEKSVLFKALDGIAIRIEHFGSTAVEGLASKPTIDILIEIPQLTEGLKTEIIQKLKALSYEFVWRMDEQIPYMNFFKGYSIRGISGQTFHIHMGDKDHPLWDRIYFRDYLRKYPSALKEYEMLKKELAVQYTFNREKYTRAKTDFIKNVTQKAKAKLA